MVSLIVAPALLPFLYVMQRHWPGGLRIKPAFLESRRADLNPARRLCSFSGSLRPGSARPVRAGQEAIADHEEAQKAFHENRERLREERLRREAAAGPMLYPAPELPDENPRLLLRYTRPVISLDRCPGPLQHADSPVT
jgi:hypothetical protein